jgi:mannose-6-phosphate isomerase-like protein (cupin superfamily)
MKPEPKVIKCKPESGDYLRLLGGPPESVRMHSGAVSLQLGRSVGKHSTEGSEEMLVVMEGEGSFQLGGSRELRMNSDTIIYCPPDTEHDVKNTGSGVLRYIYITARTKD